jgi:hypothetical protein
MRQPHLFSPQQLSPSPVLSSHFSPPAQGCSPWRWRHRRAFHPPLSSLRESDKGTLRKASPNLPFRFGSGGGDSGRTKDRRPAPDEKKKKASAATREEEEDGGGGSGALTGTLLAGAVLVGVVGGFGAAGYVYKDQINTFLTHFSGFIEGNGTIELSALSSDCFVPCLPKKL